jgi:AraC-like DNA-binding protein
MTDHSDFRASSAPIVEAGVHTPGSMRRHADRVLPVHELIVVQSGVLPIAESGRRFAVARDRWVVLQAGRRHSSYDDLDHDTWFYWICFGSASGRTSNLDATVPRGPSTGPIARPDRVRILFEVLLQDQKAGILTLTAARCYLQLILGEIQLQPPASTNQTAAARLAERAAAFIADHLSDPDLSTARIAEVLAFNADYLGRAFRDAFNETITERIHRLRIDRARMLFRSTSRSIERVAGEVGFGDDRYFRRIFSRRVGLTPGQFQRLHPSRYPS